MGHLLYPRVVTEYCHMFWNIGLYLLYAAILAWICLAFVSDFKEKHGSEVQKFYLKIGECRH